MAKRGRLPHDEEEFYGNNIGRASAIQRLASWLADLITLHVDDDRAREEGVKAADEINAAARRQQEETLKFMGKRRKERKRGKRR